MRKLILLITILPVLLPAQKKKDRDTSNLIIQPKRIEFEANRNTDFTVINGESDGLGLIVETFTKVEKKFEWSLIKLNTDLEEEWRAPFLVGAASRLLGYEYHNGKYYVMVSASQYRTEEMLVFEMRKVTLGSLRLLLSFR